MAKNLAVFFDGTWNEPNDRTNAYALYQNALERPSQETRYIEGVGTHGRGLWAAVDKFFGGAFGAGLSANIREGYQWICQRYQPDDKIYLFGFSRGAYSARSLAGLIRKCGVLHDPSENAVMEAYELYRDECLPTSDIANQFRAKFSIETDIHFVGVWDTVGSLGIPVGGIKIPGFSSFYHFHDTDLSNHVLNAYHAIAAHEFREPYAPTLWTRSEGDPRPSGLPVEQRWFAGAHSDVGGGYKDGCLQMLPAQWLQDKAQHAGLIFEPTLGAPGKDYDDCAPHDSYTEFTRKVPIPIKKAARAWKPAPQVLHMTIDSRLKKRIAGQATFLQEFVPFRKALNELPVGS